MSEEETVGVIDQGIDQQEFASPHDAEVHNDRNDEEQKTRNDQAYNWAESRREMQELKRRNQEFEQELQRLKQPAKPVEEDPLDRLADDDIITVSQVKKLVKKLARQESEDVARQRENATVDDRLMSKYSDYQEIVSRENIELLKQTEPELAQSLHAMSHDPYAQGVAAYKLIKRISGVQTPVSPDKKKAIVNSQKPLSVNAAPKASALSDAHKFEGGLTKELKDQLYREMREASKQA